MAKGVAEAIEALEGERLFDALVQHGLHGHPQHVEARGRVHDDHLPFKIIETPIPHLFYTYLTPSLDESHGLLL